VTGEGILFYDARCPGCRAFTHLVLWADTGRRLRSAPLDSPEADRVLGHLSKERRYGSFHLYSEGRLWSGGEAVGPTLERVGPVRPVGRLIRRSPAASRLATAMYRFAARHRGRVAPLFRRVGRPPR
jgi:predicted DCC family thiol-disulfide oxidoreductase YuxK